MKRMMIALALLAGACHKDQPPGPTAEQAEQLNDAEAMLNAMSAEESLSANEEGPEANASSPSNSSD
jgi:hypothetical protein